MFQKVLENYDPQNPPDLDDKQVERFTQFRCDPNLKRKLLLRDLIGTKGDVSLAKRAACMSRLASEIGISGVGVVAEAFRGGDCQRRLVFEAMKKVAKEV